MSLRSLPSPVYSCPLLVGASRNVIVATHHAILGLHVERLDAEAGEPALLWALYALTWTTARHTEHTPACSYDDWATQA